MPAKLSGNKNWFLEEDNGYTFGFEVVEKLEDFKTPYQKLEIYETREFGKMMALDGFTMFSEADEFVYHEMVSHVPLSLKSDIKNVLVVGGGDGGVVTELVKYPSVDRITLCEIDAAVIEMSKKYFPKIAHGLNDPRLSICCEDGSKYLSQQKTSQYDLVIVDSTDPIGPGAALFTEDFYSNISRVLSPQGLLIAQTESPWAEASLLAGIHKNLKSAFPFVNPILAPIFSYPRGLWSFSIATKEEIHPENLKSHLPKQELSKLNYFTEEVAKASFSLPPFYQRKLEFGSPVEN